MYEKFEYSVEMCYYCSMNNSLTELIGRAPVVALLGMCKNAGKTTALNRLIYEYRSSGVRVAVTSIGRDGETLDTVTGTRKPPIYIFEGMLAATTSGLLPLSDVSREMLEVSDIATPLGRVVVFLAKSDGYVQLAGPSIVGDMSMLIKRLQRFGADTVLIDGALSRLSPAVSALDGVCILSTGASLSADMDTVISETAHICRILALPCPGVGKRGVPLMQMIRNAREADDSASFNDAGRMWNMRKTRSGIGNLPAFSVFRDEAVESAGTIEDLLPLIKRYEAECIVFGGALTDAMARAILKSGIKLDGMLLVADDSSKILIKRETFDRLSANGAAFAVMHSTALAAVTVNPVSAGGWSFDAHRFLDEMQRAVAIPVVDVERMGEVLWL